VAHKTIFISCGQWSEPEKKLGKEIAAMVKSLTDCTPFFAEEVQDLNGLDSNILNALGECVGFITVLHPRGTINGPDGKVTVRASLWIEQEIAIATYIHRIEERPLPIIAFKHKSVSLEGIRTLLHLNPTEFVDEREVLTALPERLKAWKSLEATGIELQVATGVVSKERGHEIRRLEVFVKNDTNKRLDSFDYEIILPASVLKHWDTRYPSEVQSDISRLRQFRFNQTNNGPIAPHTRVRLTGFDYCMQCAFEDYAELEALKFEPLVIARLWVNGSQYEVVKTSRQLAGDRGDA
jgi:hypothetical protein